MNSSTSNSRAEWKVVAGVLVVLLIGEVGIYFAESRLSLDIQHTKQMPDIVGSLKKGESPRILFLGNSLTRAGVRADIIRDTWASPELPALTIGLIYPDDTILADWHYVYRRFVQPADAQIRLLVICFADKQLEDTGIVHAERLGGHFAGLSLAAEAFSNDVLSLSDRIRYLLSAASRLWANRERVQARLLALIPGYSDLARIINSAIRGDKPRQVRERPASYHRLARFLEVITRDEIKLLFVAAPLPRLYPLPEELHKTINQGGAEILDLRSVAPAGPSDFPDGYHLSPAAAERFSNALGVALINDDYVRGALLDTRRPSVKARVGMRAENSGADPTGVIVGK